MYPPADAQYTASKCNFMFFANTHHSCAAWLQLQAALPRAHQRLFSSPGDKNDGLSRSCERIVVASDQQLLDCVAQRLNLRLELRAFVREHGAGDDWARDSARAP